MVLELHLSIVPLSWVGQLGAWLRQILGTLQEKNPPRVGNYKNFAMHNSQRPHISFPPPPPGGADDKCIVASCATVLLNLVPRVLSLPRESTLDAAGHVSMYTNQIRIGGGSLT